MMKRSITTLALVGLATVSQGCFWVTTKSEGKTLGRKVTAVETKLEGQESQVEAKVQQLEKVLAEATELLAKNSANIGDDVKNMDNDLRQLRGLLNEVKRYTDEIREENAKFAAKMDERDKLYLMKLADLDQRLMAFEMKAAGPQTAPEIWKEGKAAYDKGDYETARTMFKRLVVQFPRDNNADDAQYYRAESYMKEKNYELAIAEFQKIFQSYDSSSVADDAFLRAGEAAEELKSCREARAYYNTLMTKFPKGTFAKKAKQRDAFLKKNANNSKYCKK